jgi:uncharacterized membrane protein YsdA (DUF1294 family)/cold shock CspA family protein
MKKQGTVVRWDDARGFGFIRSAASSAEVFFHVRDFRGADGPRQGLSVTFEEIHVGGKGPRGMAVRPAGDTATPAAGSRSRARATGRSHTHRGDSPPGTGAIIALPLMATHSAAMVWTVWTHLLPWWVLPAGALVNLLTFYAYWQDKYAASKGNWRIRESTLHGWSLAGGWPGAWFAQQVLRHKSRKQPFRATYWATVVLHCSALGGWIYWVKGM